MSLEDEQLNIREAAEITGLSETTIRKALGLTGRPSKLPNARKVRREGDFQDTWAIPLSDLHNAGLMKSKASRKDEQAELMAADLKTDLAKLQANFDLMAENAFLKKQIELLEANLTDLRLMLGRSIETKETQDRRKRFWQR